MPPARARSGRKRRARLAARVLGLLSLAIAIALFQFTQTSTGRNAAASLLERALQGAVDGQVRIGAVLGGNLVTRVILSDFEILDAAGDRFVSLDTVTLVYDPLALLRKQVRIRRMEAARADIRLVQDPDGRWNFDRIFGGEPEPPLVPIAPDSVPPEAPEGTPLRLIFTDARLRAGSIEIRTPWTRGLEGRERAAALAEAGAGRTPWHVEPDSAGEWDRVYRIDALSGRFPLIRLRDPPRPFRIDLEAVSGTVRAVRLPLEVAAFAGSVEFGDSVHVRVGSMETAAGSKLDGSGWVRRGEPPSYAFALDADPIAFEDLGWLPVPVPSSGGGPMRIDLESRGETAVVTVREGDVRSEETRLSGGFRIALGDPPRFEDLDLALQPLRIRWLDRLLGRPEGLDGWIRGTVRGSGPIDRLEVEADVGLSDPEGETPPSHLVARGGVSLADPFPLDSLTLEFSAFEPRWGGLLGLAVPLEGRMAGRLVLDRPPAGPLGFRGGLTYLTPEGDLSRLEGSGTLDLAAGSVVDVAIEARPLALAALRPWVTEVDLVGAVSGPIRARGNLDALHAEADLQTPRGRLVFDGRFGLAAEQPTYDAEVEASGLALDQWIESAPESRLAVRGRVTGQGLDPATLDATFDLDILPSVLQQARIDPSRLRLRVAGGMADVDTLFLNTDVGVLSGRGRFGLAEDRMGRVEFSAAVRDLAAWNRWFGDRIPGEAEAESGQELFEDFAAAMSGPTDDEPVSGWRGRLEARGVVTGNTADFTVEASVEGSAVAYEAWGADTLSAHLRIANPPGTEHLAGDLVAVGLRVSGTRIDSLAISAERNGPGGTAVEIHARRDSTLEIGGRGSVIAREGLVEVALERFRVRLGKVEAALLDASRVAYSDAALVIDAVAISGPLGRVLLDGTIPKDGNGALSVELFGIRVDQLGYLLSEAPEVGGTLSGSVAVSGRLSDPRIRGSVRVLDPAVREHRYTALDGRFDYADRRVEGSIDLSGFGLRLARLEGSVRADLGFRKVDRRLLEDPFDVRLRADSLPLQLLELRVRGLEEIDGYARGMATVTGAPGRLRYGGEMEILDGQAWVPDLGVRMRAATAHARFDGAEARIDTAYVASELGGSVSLGGVVDLASLSDPGFDLAVSARRFRAVARRDMALAIEGRGHLAGRYRSPELTGDFRLRGGDIFQDEFLRAREILDLSDPRFYSLLDSTSALERRLLERFRNPFMDNLVVDVTVDLGPNLWLRSPTLDVEMVAEDLEVRMNRATDELYVLGEVQLPRGTYRFDRIPPYVQPLRIREGRLQFVGEPELNPNLAITAEYRNRTAEGPVVIEVRLGGTLRETQIGFSSNPPMSENDQLCFLAVGAPCFAAADAQIGQRLLQEGLLGTLSSGISSALVGSTGLSYFSLRSIGGGSRARAIRGQSSLFDQRAVEFGWYAGEEVFFSFSQPLGGGPPRATLEWRFTPSWTLEARAASRFDERLFGLVRGSNLANERTFGLFLFREWSF